VVGFSASGAFAPVGAVNGRIYDNGSFRTYTNATYFRWRLFLEDPAAGASGMRLFTQPLLIMRKETRTGLPQRRTLSTH